ncbi:MAG: hypothetical protein WC459_03735 [Patescibacteria group bacterium]
MEEYKKGVLIVTFQKGTTSKEAFNFLDGLGLTIRHWASKRTASVNVPSGEEEHWKTVLDIAPIVKGVSLNIRL